MIDTEDKKWKVYMHISPSNKIYIGITSQKNINVRWRNGNGYKQCRHFWNAIQKYGWDNIEHIILFDNLQEDNAKRIEKLCIALYKSNVAQYGYNISSGGDGIVGLHRYGEENSFYGKHHTEESKLKMKQNHRDCIGENNSMYGKHHTDDVKIKLSNYRKNYYKNNPKQSLVLTEESKKKIGEQHSKIIQRFNLNMNFISEYSSLLELEKLGYRRASIRDVCLGRKASYKDSIWRYKNSEDKWTSGYIIGTKSDNIYCLNKENNIVGIYKSYSEASRDTGVHRRIISKACNDINSHFAHRYYWLFKEDYDLLINNKKR